MSKRVLIAPLDWGLGHTARCIPIIQELLQQGNDVIFAGTQKQFDFVTQHQIEIKHVELFSYNVNYAKRLPQWVKIGAQLNKLKSKIRAEHKWLNDFLSIEKIDVVISDNRYGLYSNKVHSIFIGHQLSIQSPLLSKKINSIHANYINKFNECWIPDDENINLSGELSINEKINIPTKQIGLLSRFSKYNSSANKKYDLLILLSGTEPQRSILEQKLMGALDNSTLSIALVRGTSTSPTDIYTKTKTFDLLNSNELQTLIESAETIICRSGYSSIMDIILFNKKMILIPTPGQTEQEYLAKHLKKKYNIAYLEQGKLNNLAECINKLEPSKIHSARTTLAIKV
ncbi:MAG: glycosyltransferase [Bacteroidetes bacterium]|nr:glycosyltransferase [Bacteroidota bacterium]